jgi:hypothetical protein
MSRQFWEELLATAVASGGAIATSTTETILFPNVVIPGNYMQDGRCIKVTAFGAYGTTTGSNTMRMRLRWGGVAGVALADSGAAVLTASSGGGASMTAIWSLEAIIQVRSNGSAGTAMTNGNIVFYSATVPTGGTLANYGMSAQLVSGATGGSTPVVATVDFTADTALSLTATWGTSNAANSIQGIQYTIEALN